MVTLSQRKLIEQRAIERHEAQLRAATGQPVEGRLAGLANLNPNYFAFGDDGNQAGVEINESNSLTISALYRAVDVISSVFGKTKWPVYRRLGGGALEEAPTHPLTKLMNRRANPETSAIDFRKTVMAHTIIYGNGLAKVVRDPRGRPSALWQLDPDRSELWRDQDGDLWLRVEPTTDRIGIDEVEWLPYGDVIHIKNLSHNGVMGASLLAYAKESLGMTKAAELFGARFYKNDGTSGLVAEIPGNPDPEIMRENRESYERWRTGQNQHRVLALKGGVKLHSMNKNPEESQAVETRTFQVGEVSRWTGVPPHLLGELSNATFSNIENLALQFAFFTMDRWFVSWQQEIDYKCLTPREQSMYLSEINLQTIVPIDSKTQSENDARDIEAGVTSADEVRLRRGMNPRADGYGDVFYAPLNKVPAGQMMSEDGNGEGGPDGSGSTGEPVTEDKPPAADSDAQPAEHDADPIRAYLPVIVDAAQRLAAAECEARSRTWWADDAGKRSEWIEKHGRRARAVIGPVVECLKLTPDAAMLFGAAVAGSVNERGADEDAGTDAIADIARVVLASNENQQTATETSDEHE